MVIIHRLLVRVRKSVQKIFVCYAITMIRKWDIKNKQTKKQCIDEVLARIDEQADAEFGVIATQDIIDIIAGHLGPQIYNEALEDAKKTIQTKLADLEIDIDILRVV